jgi:hypothetical protein
MLSFGTLRRRLPSLIGLALGWLLSAALIHAQTGTGSVQGRVFNPVSKDYVGNAEVRLDGTNRTTYSESDGSFQFTDVPAGPASITVLFTGYTTVKDSFTVTAGQAAVREINLVSSAAAPAPNKDGVIQLTAFTVASEREGNAKAIQAQRRNMNITTSVSSDIFGDVADGNVGEFLKYCPASTSITSSPSPAVPALAVWTVNTWVCPSTVCVTPVPMPTAVAVLPRVRPALKASPSRRSTPSRSTAPPAPRTTPTRRPAPST